MKNLVKIFAVALIFSAQSMFATTKPVDDIKNSIEEIGVIIKNSIEIEITKEVDVLVSFSVNSDNEIAVLDVKTNNEELKDLVKTSINSKKLTSEKLTVGKEYQFVLKLRNNK